MGAAKEIDQLQQNLKELEKQNNNKHTIFCSLQLVLGELKSENGRLKMEQQERAQRLEQMTKAKENMKQCRQFNSTLIKLLLEQRAIVKRYQNLPPSQCEFIKNHEIIQEALKEKILKLKEEHENLPMVKQYIELQREEALILENIEQVDKDLQEEERIAIKTLNQLDQKTFEIIVSIVVKNKLLADIECEEVEDALNQSQESILETQTSESVIRKVPRPQITIQKLDDLVFPEIPVAPQNTTQKPKIDVQAMLANIRKQIQQNLGKYSQASNTRSYSSKILRKDEKKSTVNKKSGTHESQKSNKKSPGGYMRSCVQNMDESRQLTNRPASLNKPVDQVAGKGENMLHKSKESYNNGKSSNEGNVIINEQKASNQELNIMMAPQGSKKVIILSDIVIKSATTDYSKDQARQPQCPKRDQNLQPNKLSSEVRKDTQNRPPVQQSETVATKVQTQEKVPLKQTALKRKASQGETDANLKPSPPKNAKGVKVQSFENSPIDLNSELPSSHITINSSNESDNNEKAKKQHSPTGSLNDFFNFEATSPGANERKRKLSPDATAFEGGIDFDNFDFGKKSKNGSDVASDDFLNMLGASPGRGAAADDNTMFDFEAFIGF